MPRDLFADDAAGDRRRRVVRNGQPTNDLVFSAYAGANAEMVSSRIRSCATSRTSRGPRASTSTSRARSAPLVPDAWMDRSKNKAGCEINFNRHFHAYTPPRPLAEVDVDLKRAEEEIVRLLREVAG